MTPISRFFITGPYLDTPSLSLRPGNPVHRFWDDGEHIHQLTCEPIEGRHDMIHRTTASEQLAAAKRRRCS